MVIYDLSCPLEHRFEGWFESASSFEDQCRGGYLVCPLCNSSEIKRLPSVPHLAQSSESQGLPASTRILPSSSSSGQAPMMMVSGHLVQMLRQQVVQQVLAMTEDVGDDFAEVVRDMHYGDTASKNVRGVASQDDLQDLHDEGIDVMVLGIPDVLGPAH